ncbi:MAG: DUF445 family protein, partial [Planctomycetes bacterium]|nr:DUF445 family protein [Planctomycetota bacterium]
ITRMLNGMGQDLRADPAQRARLDAWLHGAVREMVAKHHDLVGQMVRASLDPKVMSDRALVDQIESKVGDDLQYIRLNGAIVGGMVGVCLAALKLYVL